MQILAHSCTKHRFEYDNLRDGALLILWGFAKKLILAERLGTFVDQIYGNYTQYTGMLFFFVATAAFSIQIYADFSGCMDIATGTARLSRWRRMQSLSCPMTRGLKRSSA